MGGGDGDGDGESHGSLHRSTINAIAGAVAGGVARTVVSPLDVIKIRFQVQLEPTSTRAAFAGGMTPGISKYTGVVQAARLIVQEEGIRGLWRGNVAGLVMQMPYTAIQFVVMSNFKTLVSSSPQAARYEGSLSYVGGALAGSAATLGSYPFDLLRTVLASQGEPKVYPNMRSAMVDIYKRKGVRGLYAGLTPTLLEIVPYAGLQFGSYDTLKRWTHALNQLKDGSGDTSLSNTQQIACGFGAGLFAKLCCHPLDVIKKRYQVEGLMRDLRYGARIEDRAYKGMLDAIRRIVAEEGLKGLYKGTLPSLVKAAPNSAIIFYVHESTVAWLTSHF
ncbi:hypothetical protein KC19_10G015600 [Ceratodon purpureus]|uniref:Uncharacterized protein n=1 Tax=Ceratodon purpureus TaxID=3225 RepID=A0A8T0GGY4_CERPU|nr:hypothetical protein KC19_10G015600 [Ceratodon purpureus]